MANQKISQLALAGALTGVELVELVQGGANVKATAQDVADLVSLAGFSTTDLAEGTNLYYTAARFDTALGTKDTDDLAEGAVNFYYTASRFNTSFSGKSTTDLTEGTNLYFTDARARTAAVADTITDGVTTIAPSQNAVFDALALKQPLDTQLTSLAALAYAGNSLKVVRLNAGETDFEFATIAAGATALDGLSDCITDYTNNSMYLGESSGAAATTAQFNTAIGDGALVNVTTGDNNTALGSNTGATLVSGSGNILIGDSIDVAAAGTSGYINIGGKFVFDSGTNEITLDGTLVIGGFLSAATLSGDLDLNGNTLLNVPDPVIASDPVNKNYSDEGNSFVDASSIAPTGSPFAYTNSNAYEEDVIISGGTVTQIDFIRQGNNYVLGITSGMVRLSGADAVEVTYAVAPTMTKVPR